MHHDLSQMQLVISMPHAITDFNRANVYKMA
jgi:hypothetical protein